MSRARRSIRIVSYNVHACIGRDGQFMPERIAEVLASLDADFIALQEIEDRTHEGQTVSRYLAGRLGMHCLCGVTLRRGDAHYGNVLLSREGAAAHRFHDISLPGREPRGAIEADFDLEEKTLRIFVTHLGLRAGERRHQLRLLIPKIRRDDADIRVLAGDINEWRPAAAANRLLGKTLGAVPRLRTYPAAAPLFSLDRIYVAPADCIDAWSTVATPLARTASDHLPLLAQLAVTASPGPR